MKTWTWKITFKDNPFSKHFEFVKIKAFSRQDAKIKFLTHYPNMIIKEIKLVESKYSIN